MRGFPHRLVASAALSRNMYVVGTYVVGMYVLYYLLIHGSPGVDVSNFWFLAFVDTGSHRIPQTTVVSSKAVRDERLVSVQLAHGSYMQCSKQQFWSSIAGTSPPCTSYKRYLYLVQFVSHSL